MKLLTPNLKWKAELFSITKPKLFHLKILLSFINIIKTTMFGVILSQGRWKGMKYEKVDSGFPLDLFDKKMCMSEIRLRMLISF